jgi:hypothetical protein
MMTYFFKILFLFHNHHFSTTSLFFFFKHITSFSPTCFQPYINSMFNHPKTRVKSLFFFLYSGFKGSKQTIFQIFGSRRVAKDHTTHKVGYFGLSSCHSKKKRNKALIISILHTNQNNYQI